MYSNNIPYIIAEIGNNHQGKTELAKKLILAAKEAGASAVKFQTFRTEYYLNKENKKRFKKLKKFELTKKNFVYLSQMTKELNFTTKLTTMRIVLQIHMVNIVISWNFLKISLKN